MVEVTQEDHGCAADVEEAIWNESEDIAVIIARHRTTALAAKEAENAELRERADALALQADEWEGKYATVSDMNAQLRATLAERNNELHVTIAQAQEWRAEATSAEAELAAEREKVGKLRKALEDIDYYTSTHASQKYALEGINTIREDVRAALAETQP